MTDQSARVDALFSRLHDLCGEGVERRLRKMGMEREARSAELTDRVRALSAMVLGHTESDPERAIALAEEKVADWIAMEAAEKRLKRMAERKLREREADVWRDLELRLLRQMPGAASPGALERYAKWCALDGVSLGDGYSRARPSAREELIGQEEAWRAILAALATPYPQHILLYGPPGVGKTSSARLALDAAKGVAGSRFLPDAPFVEVDGATLRWDERNSADPLMGSVHDPIYQGARAELGESGVPEPRPGLVTQAHGGVLFIDEIGELPPLVLGRLLKVLEDRRVRFSSPYYDPADPSVPPDIHKLFADGAPADFILVGATTRSPGELPEALRSRCVEARFRPLTMDQLARVARGVAFRLDAVITPAAARLVAAAADDGREATRLVTAALSAAVAKREGERRIDARGAKRAVETVKPGRRAACAAGERDAVGRVKALGVRGSVGCIVTIEAAVFPAKRGEVRFNAAAGDMARDAVHAALIALRAGMGVDVSQMEVVVNATGGGQVDGPSLGLAAALAVYSAVKGLPLRQSVGVTGEISLYGQVLPVGGVAEKCDAARRAGFGTVILPDGCAPPMIGQIAVRPVGDIARALEIIAGSKIAGETDGIAGKPRAAAQHGRGTVGTGRDDDGRERGALRDRAAARR